MIYFVSDIHLGGGADGHSRNIERRFIAWLDMVSDDAEAIFLVGDIFDFWFEYKQVVPKGFTRVLGRLAALTDRGVRVVFFAGNHDMWVRDYLTQECGIEIHHHPEVVTLAGRRIFIAHGDNMNIANQLTLRLLNATFRSRTLYRFFSWAVHPNRMVHFGRRWSCSSRDKHNKDDFNASLTEPLIAYAREYARGHEVDDFVFGHMHYARDYREQGLHTVHLGCWEKNPSYAMLDKAGNLTLKMFDQP